MGRVHQPLAQHDGDLEPRLHGGDREDGGAPQGAGLERRAEIRPRHVLHARPHVDRIFQGSDGDLRSGALEAPAALVDPPDEGPDAVALLQELQSGRHSGLAGGSGNQDLRLAHCSTSGESKFDLV